MKLFHVICTSCVLAGYNLGGWLSVFVFDFCVSSLEATLL